MEHRNNVSLNLNVRGLTPSATVAINERSQAMIRDGRKVFKLGLGQSPFPVPQPVVEALKINAHQKDYLAVQGLPDLREAVAAFHHQNDGVEACPDCIMIGPGSKELMFLLQIAYYGDLVVPTPCWVSYKPQAHIIGRHVIELPTSFAAQWRLRPEDLDAHCRQDPGRPRVVVLNYPGNPDGGSYTPDQLRELAAVAREHGVVLLSDEIYGKIHHRGEHESISRYYPEGTIISSGLSKWCGAGGWRLGTFTFPRSLRWLLEAMVAVASETYTTTSAPIQYAAVRAFHGGVVIERYLAHVRRILRTLGAWCTARLRETGAQMIDPVGAFYVFPDFGPLAERLAERGITTSTALCERALDEAGVAFLPGVEFGRPPEELTVRLAYVDFDGARALAAGETIPLFDELDDHFLRTYCHRTVHGIEQLCDWLGSL